APAGPVQTTPRVTTRSCHARISIESSRSPPHAGRPARRCGRNASMRPLGNAALSTMIPRLRKSQAQFDDPLVDAMAEAEDSPFKILIATLISLRTRDTLTAVVAPRLFALADTPAA